MGLAPGQHDAGALGLALRGFLQMLGQAARIARGRARRGAQQRCQPVGRSAEVHLGQRLAAQGAQVGIVGPQARGVLLGAPHGHIQQLGRLRQTPRIGQHRRAVVDGGHQLVLKIHQDELGFSGVEEHERIFLSCGCNGRIVAAKSGAQPLCAPHSGGTCLHGPTERRPNARASHRQRGPRARSA
jgi:hypothetical protein